MPDSRALRTQQEAGTTVQPPDPSIRPEQITRLATADAGDVAAALAAVLVGRHVRGERPKTQAEADAYGEPDVPWGWVGVVTDVHVDTRGRVVLVWDWGFSEPLLVPGTPHPLARTTFWVLDEPPGDDPLAWLSPKARERVMQAAAQQVRGQTPPLFRLTPVDSGGTQDLAGEACLAGVTGRAHLQVGECVVEVVDGHTPHRGSDVEGWLERQREARRGVVGWTALDSLLAEYRRLADTGAPLLPDPAGDSR